MEFTDFGTKLSSHSGILQLMDDIGRPLPAGIKARPLGGGNPARVLPSGAVSITCIVRTVITRRVPARALPFP